METFQALEVSLSNALSFLICRDYTLWPRRPSARISLLSGLIFGFLFFAVYNAVLVSFMASEPIEWPTTSLEDISKTSKKIVLMRGTAAEDFFKHSKNGSITRELYEHNSVTVDNFLYVSRT